VAVPAIAQDLEASAILISWVPTAFLLANAVLMLPAGRMADIHGRKKVYLTGMLVFTVSCLLASVVPDIEWLLFTRLLQGFGAALTFATGLAIIMSVFSTENRGMALGFASASLYIGLSLGPLLGGWFTEYYGWRSVFLFPVVPAVISVLMILLKLKGEWKSETAQPVDWFGSLIFAVWSSALFIGMSEIPSPRSFLLLFAGIVSLIYFFYQQAHAASPLIRFRAIMENHVFSRSLMASMCTYASNYPLIFLFSLYLQFIQGMSPVEAGQIMVLQAVMMAIVAPFSGRLSDQFEPRLIATAGCLVMSLAFAALVTIHAGTSIYLIAATMLTLGIGFGLFTVPNNNAALSAVQKDRLGIATALLNLTRIIGNMFGTAFTLFLVAVFIGQAKIQPDQFPALLTVVRIALAASLLLSALGAYFSFIRGDIQRK